MIEEGVYCAIEEVTPVANKVQRAQSIQGRMAMGKVYFPTVAPWMVKATDELMKFPNARHDDFVDALSWVGMGLQRQHGPAITKNIRIIPKEGTFGWVKFDSDYRASIQQRRKSAVGF